MTKEEMVQKFQCPGCVCGSSTKCGSYAFSEDYLKCNSHVLGISLGLGNKIALGLPKGFNKPGIAPGDYKSFNQMSIRLWSQGECPDWDRLNIPVWALEQEGFLFVRTFAPRINVSWVDVIEKGTLEMVPDATNVLDFIENID